MLVNAGGSVASARAYPASKAARVVPGGGANSSTVPSIDDIAERAAAAKEKAGKQESSKLGAAAGAVASVAGGVAGVVGSAIDAADSADKGERAPAAAGDLASGDNLAAESLDFARAAIPTIGSALLVIAKGLADLGEVAPYAAPLARLIKRGCNAIHEVRMLQEDCDKFAGLLVRTCGALVASKSALEALEDDESVRTHLDLFTEDVRIGVQLVESCTDATWFKKLFDRGDRRSSFKGASEGLLHNFLRLIAVLGAANVTATTRVGGKVDAARSDVAVVAEEVHVTLSELRAHRWHFQEEANLKRAMSRRAIVHNLPPPVQLVGRGGDLDRVDAHLNGGTPLTGIVGDAGVGKSALATAIAFEALGRAVNTTHDLPSASHLVWKLQAQTVGSLVESYASLLKDEFEYSDDSLMPKTVKGKSPQELADALMAELRRSKYTSWILVFDNVAETGYTGGCGDDSGFDSIRPHFFSSLIGMGTTGRIVFTCRKPIFFSDVVKIADDWVQCRDVRIKSLGDSDGARLLLSIPTGRWIDAGEREEAAAAEEISRALKGLPLALRLSGALLTPEECVHDGGRPRDQQVYTIFDLKREVVDSVQEADDDRVGVILALSLDNARRASPGASAALDIAAFFDPDGIPLHMLRADYWMILEVLHMDLARLKVLTTWNHRSGGSVVSLLTHTCTCVRMAVVYVITCVTWWLKKLRWELCGPKMVTARQEDVDHLVKLGLLRVVRDAPTTKDFSATGGATSEPIYAIHRLVQRAARSGRHIWSPVRILAAEMLAASKYRQYMYLINLTRTCRVPSQLRPLYFHQVGLHAQALGRVAQEVGMEDIASHISVMDVHGARDNTAWLGVLGQPPAPTMIFPYEDMGNGGAIAAGLLLRANPSATRLRLAYSGIGDEGAVVIGKSLDSNTSLLTLDLRNNRISDYGIKTICTGLHLSSNMTLRCLMLSKNSIGDEGAAAIGKGLKTNTTLQWLDLDNNHIGDKGAAAIGKGLQTNTVLQSLNLASNYIGNQGAEAIIKRLSPSVGLESLKLDGNKINDDNEEAAAIVKNPSIRKLLVQKLSCSAEAPVPRPVRSPGLDDVPEINHRPKIWSDPVPSPGLDDVPEIDHRSKLWSDKDAVRATRTMLTLPDIRQHFGNARREESSDREADPSGGVKLTLEVLREHVRLSQAEYAQAQQVG